MQATLEISLYPFSEDYKTIVTEFILRLRKHRTLKIETNGMSTQVFGDYDLLMDILKEEMKSTLKKHQALFVFKIATGTLSIEHLPESLK